MKSEVKTEGAIDSDLVIRFSKPFDIVGDHQFGDGSFHLLLPYEGFFERGGINIHLPAMTYWC